MIDPSQLKKDGMKTLYEDLIYGKRYMYLQIRNNKTEVKAHNAARHSKSLELKDPLLAEKTTRPNFNVTRYRKDANSRIFIETTIRNFRSQLQWSTMQCSLSFKNTTFK